MFDNEYAPENMRNFSRRCMGAISFPWARLPAVDSMLSGLDADGSFAAREPRKALELGFGLGGAAFHLAQTRGLEIAGVEVHPWMVKYAQTHAPPDVANLLRFDVYDANGQIPFEAESFDLAYSKGVLEYVDEKVPLFRQVSSRLRADGMFVICDWVYPEGATATSDQTQVRETEQSYRSALDAAHFRAISFSLRHQSVRHVSHCALGQHRKSSGLDRKKIWS